MRTGVDAIARERKFPDADTAETGPSASHSLFWLSWRTRMEAVTSL